VSTRNQRRVVKRRYILIVSATDSWSHMQIAYVHICLHRFIRSFLTRDALVTETYSVQLNCGTLRRHSSEPNEKHHVCRHSHLHSVLSRPYCSSSSLRPLVPSSFLRWWLITNTRRWHREIDVIFDKNKRCQQHWQTAVAEYSYGSFVWKFNGEAGGFVICVAGDQSRNRMTSSLLVLLTDYL